MCEYTNCKLQNEGVEACNFTQETCQDSSDGSVILCFAFMLTEGNVTTVLKGCWTNYRPLPENLEECVDLREENNTLFCVCKHTMCNVKVFYVKVISNIGPATCYPYTGYFYVTVSMFVCLLLV